MVGNILSVFSYTLLLTLDFQEEYFISQNINLAPQRASEIVLLKSSFDSKRDSAGDDASLGYSNLYPHTVNMTLNGYDFSGR